MPQFTGQQVADYFKQFGLTASPEEMAAFTGIDYIGGGSSIADYVLTKKNIAEQQANDPLNKVMQAEQTFATAQEAAAQGYGQQADQLYGQLQDIMGQAPKLFGNLTTDQIDQYLAPLKTTFTAADATAQTGAAARGIAGSSIESKARQDAANTFKENVLSTGLNVGINQQTQNENLLTQQIAQKNSLLMGANNNVSSALGLANQSGGQLSSQANQNALLMSSLPNYLQAQNLQNLITQKQLNEWDSSSFARKFGSITGMINTGFNTLGNSANQIQNVASAPFKGLPSGSFMGFGASSQPVPPAYQSSGQLQGTPNFGPMTTATA